jgi:hypothetical protein
VFLLLLLFVCRFVLYFSHMGNGFVMGKYRDALSYVSSRA